MVGERHPLTPDSFFQAVLAWAAANCMCNRLFTSKGGVGQSSSHRNHHWWKRKCSQREWTRSLCQPKYLLLRTRKTGVGGDGAESYLAPAVGALVKNWARTSPGSLVTVPAGGHFLTLITRGLPPAPAPTGPLILSLLLQSSPSTLLLTPHSFCEGGLFSLFLTDMQSSPVQVVSAQSRVFRVKRYQEERDAHPEQCCWKLWSATRGLGRRIPAALFSEHHWIL